MQVHAGHARRHEGGPHVYQPSRQLFSLLVRVMTVISLIVLSGDIQINPGPLQFGCLNCCSAAPKVPLIHDLMNDNSLDVLLLSETWFTTDTPQSVLLDVAPTGYAGLHVVRLVPAGSHAAADSPSCSASLCLSGCTTSPASFSRRRTNFNCYVSVPLRRLSPSCTSTGRNGCRRSPVSSTSWLTSSQS